MAQEGFVLLVTDAPDRTRLLSRGVDPRVIVAAALGTDAPAPPVPAASKLAMRTVRTLILSDDLTVCTAAEV